MNLYEKTSFRGFCHKISRITPVETKQGTSRSWFDGESHDDGARMHNINTTDWPGWTALATWRVGRDAPGRAVEEAGTRQDASGHLGRNGRNALGHTSAFFSFLSLSPQGCLSKISDSSILRILSFNLFLRIYTKLLVTRNTFLGSFGC